MNKQYKDVICKLKGIDSVEHFATESIKYFLNQSNDFDIIANCNESLFYQLTVFIRNPEHPNVQQILFATYGKMILRKIFIILKQGALDNLNNIQQYVQHDLLILTSHSEVDAVMASLEEIYNSILEIHYEFTEAITKDS